MACRCGQQFDWAAMSDVHGAGASALFRQRVAAARKARLVLRSNATTSSSSSSSSSSMHEQRFQIFVVAQSNRTIALELPLRAQTRLVDLVALVAARSAIEGAHRRENKSKARNMQRRVCV